MSKKKVLITYATYGSGHKTVANYLANYLINHSDYEKDNIELQNKVISLIRSHK